MPKRARAEADSPTRHAPASKRTRVDVAPGPVAPKEKKQRKPRTTKPFRAPARPDVDEDDEGIAAPVYVAPPVYVGQRRLNLAPLADAASLPSVEADQVPEVSMDGVTASVKLHAAPEWLEYPEKMEAAEWEAELDTAVLVEGPPRGKPSAAVITPEGAGRWIAARAQIFYDRVFAAWGGRLLMRVSYTANLTKPSATGDRDCTWTAWCERRFITSASQLRRAIARMPDDVAQVYDTEVLKKGSGLTWVSLANCTLYASRLHADAVDHDEAGGDWRPTPKWLTDKKAVVNIKSKPGECLLTALLAARHAKAAGRTDRLAPLEKLEKALPASERLSVAVRDWPLSQLGEVEAANAHLGLGITVYGVSIKKDGTPCATALRGAQRPPGGQPKWHVVLLLLRSGERGETSKKFEESGHYVWVPSLSRLTADADGTHTRLYCDYCTWSCDARYPETLSKHVLAGCAVCPERVLSERTICFKGNGHMLRGAQRVSLFGVWDTESLLVSTGAEKPTDEAAYTVVAQRHVPIAAGIALIKPLNGSVVPPQYHEEVGEDAVDRMLLWLIAQTPAASAFVRHVEKMGRKTLVGERLVSVWTAFDDAEECCLCAEPLDRSIPPNLAELVAQDKRARQASRQPQLKRAWSRAEQAVVLPILDEPPMSDEDLEAYIVSIERQDVEAVEEEAVEELTCEKEAEDVVPYKMDKELVDYLNRRAVMHHCHANGRYLGAAHSLCNLQCSVPHEATIWAHNLSGYDGAALVQALGRLALAVDEEGKSLLAGIGIEATPCNQQRYKEIALSVPVAGMRRPFVWRFRDSIGHLAGSLEQFADKLGKTQKDQPELAFPQLAAWVQIKVPKTEDRDSMSEAQSALLRILCRKGEWPYDWATSLERLQTATAPPALSELPPPSLGELMSAEDHARMCVNFSSLHCKNMEQYMRWYLRADVLLLADVLASHSGKSMEFAGLDPLAFISSPAWAWAGLLRMTKARLTLPTDMRMVQALLKCVRGGVCDVGSLRHVKANHPYMADYSPDVEKTWVFDVDATSLYPTAWSKYPTPQDGLHWGEMTLEEVLSPSSSSVPPASFLEHIETVREELVDPEAEAEESERGEKRRNRAKERKEQHLAELRRIARERGKGTWGDAFVCVDGYFPEAVRASLAEYVPLPEVMQVTREMLATSERQAAFDKVPTGPQLIAHLGPRRGYWVHTALLRDAIKRGFVVVGERFQAIRFRQSRWVKPWLDHCVGWRARCRKEVKDLKEEAEKLDKEGKHKEAETLRCKIEGFELEADAAKLAMNSCFGKTSQNPRKYSSVKILRADDAAAIEKIVCSPRYEGSWIRDTGGLSWFHTRQPTITFSSPLQIGAAVLDLSKLHMQRFWYDALVPCFGSDLKRVYGDTDSLYCAIKSEDDVFAKLMGGDERLAAWMDFSNLPEKHPAHNSDTAAQLGLFKLDNPPLAWVKRADGTVEPPAGIVTEFVGVAAKVYSVRYQHKEAGKLKTKGVPKAIAKAQLRHDEMVATVLATQTVVPEPKRVEFGAIRIAAAKDSVAMVTKLLKKAAYSGFDSKRRWTTGVASEPWGMDAEEGV
jgi:hypothetical protein